MACLKQVHFVQAHKHRQESLEFSTQKKDKNTTGVL